VGRSARDTGKQSRDAVCAGARHVNASPPPGFSADPHGTFTSRRITIPASIERTHDMARTRVSPKYQVVIPKEIRERHKLRPGQEMQVISKGDVITLVPDRPLSAFRGVLRGMSTDAHREKKDRRL
jgi:AbrB family looped-hinge helix DNA binding protein